MPLMREWVEIAVDEDLLVQVTRELLDLAANPNDVEIVHGTTGRVILADVHLAEAWYQLRLNQVADTEVHTDDDIVADTEVIDVAEVATSTEIGTESVAAEVVDVAQVAMSTVDVAEDLVPLPVRRGPGRPRKVTTPSASPDGEEP